MMVGCKHEVFCDGMISLGRIYTGHDIFSHNWW